MEMRRMMVAAAAAVGASVVLASPAAAWTPGEDAYLNQLAGTVGFTVNPFTSGFLVGAGNTVCADLRAGMSPEDAAVKQLSFPGSSLALTRLMVGAAQTTICPETVR